MPNNLKQHNNTTPQQHATTQPTTRTRKRTRACNNATATGHWILDSLPLPFQLCCALCFLTPYSNSKKPTRSKFKMKRKPKHNTSVVHSTLDTRIGTWKKKNPYSSCIVQSVVRRPSHVTYHTSWSPRRQLVFGVRLASLRLAWLGLVSSLVLILLPSSLPSNLELQRP